MHEAAIIPAEEARDPERFRLHPVGAGPFRVEEAIEGQRVRAASAIATTTSPGMPHLDELKFRLDLRSFRDVAEAFLRGELDVAHGIPLKIVNELRNDPRYRAVHADRRCSSTRRTSATTAPPRRSTASRCARRSTTPSTAQRINERVYAGLGVVAESLLPPGLLGYDPTLRGFDHDPDARAIADAPGRLRGGFTIEYRTWDTDEFNNSGTLPLIIEDLAAIGIRRQRHARTPPTEAREPLPTPGHGHVLLRELVRRLPRLRQLLLHLLPQRVAFDPRLLLPPRRSSTRRSSRRAARTTSGRAARSTAQLDEMVVREAPIAPLFHERFFVLHKPEVRGLRTSLVPPPVRYHETWIEE